MENLKLTLNTSDGQVAFQTSLIKGKLDGVVIQSNDKVEVIINSLLGYNILTLHEHIGDEYYAPRSILRQPDKSIMGFDQFDRFHLDEELLIIVRGPRGKDITLQIRYDD